MSAFRLRPVPPPSDQDEHPLHRRQNRGGAAGAAAPVALALTLNADWAAASVARHRVKDWLRAHRWSPAHVEDLVLAISEAISNSVEHGYGVAIDTVGHPGPVELRGRVTTGLDGLRRAEFTVRDEGCWREPASHSTGRGGGFTIMRACTDEVSIDGTAAGTTVVLRSRPSPPPLTST